MRRALPTALTVLSLLLPAATAFAGSPFFLTGKIGQTSLEADVPNAIEGILDGDDDSWSFGFGFQTGRYASFQIEYFDLGTTTALGETAMIEADSTAIALSTMPQYPLTDNFSVYAKLGFISYESSISSAIDVGENFAGDFEDDDILLGIGVRFLPPGPFGVFVEFERVSDTFDTVSIGALFGF